MLLLPQPSSPGKQSPRYKEQLAPAKQQERQDRLMPREGPFFRHLLAPQQTSATPSQRTDRPPSVHPYVTNLFASEPFLQSPAPLVEMALAKVNQSQPCLCSCSQGTFSALMSAANTHHFLLCPISYSVPFPTTVTAAQSPGHPPSLRPLVHWPSPSGTY